MSQVRERCLATVSSVMRRDESRAHQIAYGPPLDYSNGRLTDLRKILQYEPRTKGVSYIPAIDPESGFYKSSSLIISYNRINSLEPLRWTLKKLMKEPMWLRWLDASYNDISELDISLRLFKHLRKCNLDGNPIQSFVELTVFMKIPRLHHLSLSHCPIYDAPFYRAHVISLLPQLLTLDNRTILPSERDVAGRAYFTRLPLVEPVSPPETIEAEEEEPFPEWLTEIVDHMNKLKEGRVIKRINREMERRRLRRIRKGLPEEPEEGEVDDDDEDDFAGPSGEPSKVEAKKKSNQVLGKEEAKKKSNQVLGKEEAKKKSNQVLGKEEAKKKSNQVLGKEEAKEMSNQVLGKEEAQDPQQSKQQQPEVTEQKPVEDQS